MSPPPAAVLGFPPGLPESFHADLEEVSLTSGRSQMSVSKVSPAQRQDEDYTLRWPPTLLKRELSRELNHRTVKDWGERCELLLEQAFVSRRAVDDFRAHQPEPADPWGRSMVSAAPRLTDQQRWLQQLLSRVDTLPTITTTARPYFSQRHAVSTRTAARSIESAAGLFVSLFSELEDLGYFEETMGKDCPDDPTAVDPADAIALKLSRPGLWPIDPELCRKDPTLLFDLIEVLHDLVSAPRARWMHPFGGCGWHHGDYSGSRGQEVYRWRVNRLLEDSAADLYLAEAGEDRGRLVHVLDPARHELIEKMTDPAREPRDDVLHAIALYRSRGATVQDKTSANRALAGVLEERRALLKDVLVTKDESALFEIANKFSIRHKDARQRSDYDPVFLDWIFWWYLATVELTSRVLDSRVSAARGATGVAQAARVGDDAQGGTGDPLVTRPRGPAPHGAWPSVEQKETP